MSTPYIFRSMYKIKGYMDPADALIFSTIFEGQNQDSLTGGAAEIGVYYGRSYYLIRHLLRHDEKILASDLFDMGQNSTGMSDQMREFVNTGDRLALPVDPDLVIAGQSSNITSSIILDKVGKVRFFHIDGGHELENVHGDSLLARETTADYGIICFDDFFNPGWPEVTIGVVDFLQEQGNDYSLFLMSNKKAYLARRDYVERYQSMIMRSSNLRNFPKLERTFLGVPMIFLNHQQERRVIYELLVRTGLGRASGLLY